MATPTNIIINITCEMKAKPHLTDTLCYIMEVDLKTPKRFIKKIARLCKQYGYKLSTKRESGAEQQGGLQWQRKHTYKSASQH